MKDIEFSFDALVGSIEEMIAEHEGQHDDLRSWKYQGSVLIEIREDGETVWDIAQGATEAMAYLRDHEVKDTAQFTKVLRACLRQTQKGFAQLLGVSLKSVQNWEQGLRKPPSAARKLLATAYSEPRALLGAEEHLNAIPA